MAHELTHALQDQHFNLRRFEHWPKGDSDAELAAHALIEGDATLSMMLYIANNPIRALAFLKSLGGTEMSSAELDKAPRALRETLLFPYTDGTDWTRNLYKAGGWDRVSKAFTELPQSTEQVLHPEKYFAHEAPVKVTLPDIAPLLNAGGRAQGSGVSERSAVSHQRSVGRNSLPITHHSSLRDLQDSSAQPPASWKRLESDVEGEWGLYLVLDQFLKAPAESRRAAAGWGGDRYEVYENPKGEVMFVSLSTWDTENDAREFFGAYGKRTELRYPSAENLEAKSAVRTPKSEAENLNAQAANVRAFGTREGIIIVARRGPRVLVIEGCPEVIDRSTLVNFLWQ